MERALTYITLDVGKIDSGVLIKAKRGDSARRLVVSLTNRGRPYIPGEGVTAVFYERKPDGNPCFNAADIDGCTVTYDFTGQTTNVEGLAACEIRLYDAGNHLLTSPRFELLVDDTEYQEGDVPDSSPEFTALTQMIGEGTAIIGELREALDGLGNVEEILEQAEASAQAAATSQHNAARIADNVEGLAVNTETNAQSAAESAQEAAKHRAAALEGARVSGSYADDARTQAETAANYARMAQEEAERAENVQGSGGIAEETDPTVPEWAKQPNKPSYTAAEVGAEPAGTVVSNIQSHNVGRYTHEDIRLELRALADRVNAALNSTDGDLDQLAEIVAYIKSNKSLIDAITTSKVSVSDIVDNLSTNVTGRPLSAAQGVALKVLIDGLSTGKLDASALPDAVKTALAQAKADGEFDGEDGVTPHIGENGNWYLGDTDTGVKAQGANGKDGADGADGKTPVKGVDYYTEEDKNEIAALALELLGGNPVWGTVDGNNHVIVHGLAEGTYTFGFVMADGSIVDGGELVLDNNTYYSVTNNLTNCVSSNSAVQVVEGESYAAAITANSGYELESVLVTMGGADVSATAVSGGNITIASVTGDTVITAVAEEVQSGPAYTNLADPTDATGQAAWDSGGWCNASYMAGSSYEYRSGAADRVTTNTFAVEHGDTIYVKGIKYDTTGANLQIAIFDAEGTRIYHSSITNTVNNSYISNVASESEDYWYFTNVGKSNGADLGTRSIRIAGYLSGTASDVIITRNQPIA